VCRARLPSPASQLLVQTGVAATQKCCLPSATLRDRGKAEILQWLFTAQKNLKIIACQ